jgi:hypothetical protein
VFRCLCQKLMLNALFYLFVCLPHFHGVALVIYSFEFCEKTCKLEKEELVFLLC